MSSASTLRGSRVAALLCIRVMDESIWMRVFILSLTMFAARDTAESVWASSCSLYRSRVRSSSIMPRQLDRRSIIIRRTKVRVRKNRGFILFFKLL